MKFIYSTFLLTVLFACSEKETQDVDLLITNATIVDVVSGRITENQSIGISADTIRFVGTTSEKNSIKATKTIDAKGQFVMPGLWDNHVHFRGGDTLVEANKRFLPLFLRYGITTVRDAGGDMSASVLEWKKDIEKGTLDGPDIFTSGPKLDGDKPAWPGSLKVTNEQEIKEALDSLQSLNVDFVKIYDGNLTKENFYGIIKEAEKRGLKTTGHMPMSGDFMEAVSYGLDGSEHMYYMLKACSPKADSLTQLGLGYGMMPEIVDSYGPDLAKGVFKTLADKNVFVTPTIYIGKTLSELADADHSQDSLLSKMGDGIVKTYQGRINSAKRAKAAGSSSRQDMGDLVLKILPEMVDAGVPIMAGSDCGAFNSYVYPGQSLIEELRMMVDAGLSPQQALATSLIHGPKFFELGNYYGSVEVGKVAHLLLLKKNPLEDISALLNLIIVIKNDRSYSTTELDAM